MFGHVLVGVDEYEGGRDAIALGKSLLARDGKLTLGNIYAGDPHVYRSASAAYEATEQAYSLGLLEKIRGEEELDADLRSAGAPSVGRGLHELAEREGADLLVVGSCRRGLLGRVLISDDTRAALNGAPCAVAVAPAGFAHEPVVVREVGVGYDGSPESAHALELARELSNDFGARLSAFTAVSIPTRAFGPGQIPVSELIRTRVEEAREDIAALGGVEPHAAYGRAAEELALYSASLDILVVGSRGYGPLGRLVHGSTSRHLTRLTRCPLLVLPRGARSVEVTHASQNQESYERSPA
jgi:nucleotide-binding universal stress UspA family protein